MKNIFNQKRKYSIRKFSVGVCSVFIGSCIIGLSQTISRAETVDHYRTNNGMLNIRNRSNDVGSDENLQNYDSKKIAHSDLNVTGENVYQDNQGVDKLIDGNLDTLAELKWDYEPNYVNGRLPENITLPQTISLSKKDGQNFLLSEVTINKRIHANGTLMAYKITAYLNGEQVYESDRINTSFDEEISHVAINPVSVNKVNITFLEANNTETQKDLKKLSIREVSLSESVLRENTNTDNNDNTSESASNTEETGSSTNDTFVRPSAGVGAITEFTFHDGKANITFETGEKAELSLYNDHVFRYNIEKNGEFSEHPKPSREDRPAHIVLKERVNYDNHKTAGRLITEENQYIIDTDKVQIIFDKATSRMSIYDKLKQQIVAKEVLPVQITPNKSTQVFAQQANEYFFGGGMQNGRFTHKGNKINIINENNWVDGGVASPSPFYWSTNGYGVLRNTFKPGRYDFGASESKQVENYHEEDRFDAFYFVNQKPTDIIKDYHELTGKPVVLPEYALYLGHLNAYNRDYWVEVPAGTPGAILLDGKYYKEYQPNQLPESEKNTAVKETLNGENGSYIFSARAVIDRYKANNMPLSWFLPNDGYGAGYGQASTIDGNIQNLKNFVEYAKTNGIKVGLWTQSDLYDTSPDKAVVLHRDVDKEVSQAGIRAIKTDVAWVGPGYSFGLNGVDAGSKLLTEKSGDNSRPFIISLDGWGGTQRSAAIWSGDQTGGEWEYIRFHIPTYIGLGLSGNPNMGSDMDGIFGGNNAIINAREYQWKTYTSILMNMDGWGAKPKTPFSFDERTTDLNRIALKTKSTLVPYAYSTGHEAAETGKPIVRAMFLEFPNDPINYTKAVQYQYMYGDSLLVAPIYKNTAMKDNGDDIRNNIVLPDSNTEWIDLYTGKKYQGGQILNGFDAPLWKIPVFVRNGAIIPMANANNNPTEIDRTNRLIQFYPHQNSQFTLVEDDGVTVGYKNGQVAKTLIDSHAGNSNEKGQAVLTINRTTGNFDTFVKEKTTELHVNVSEDVDTVHATVNGQNITLTRVNSLEEYKTKENVFYYHESPIMETYNPASADVQNLNVKMNNLVKIKLGKVDVSQSDIVVTIDGFINKSKEDTNVDSLTIPEIPNGLNAPETTISSTTIGLNWNAVEGAESYDIKKGDTIYTGIKNTSFLFEDLEQGSQHTFAVRAVNKKGTSDWSQPISATTNDDPWANAIEGIRATTDISEQGGQEIGHLFNRQLNDMFHSAWNQEAKFPSNILIDLGGVYDLDYLEYHPRTDGGLNGIISSLYFQTSEDGKTWKTDQYYTNWATDSKVKTHRFDQTKARYINISIANGYGKFISGNEIIVFKKPGTKVQVPGDINRDGIISQDDKTSFLNYTGLRAVDNDFDYIRHVDSNNNGLIDAQDINVIAVQLDGGVSSPTTENPSGRLYLEADKLKLAKGETVEVRLMAENLQAVNALTSTFDFDSNKLRVVGNQIVASSEFTKQSENFSTVKTRQNGGNAVFSFINFGQKEPLSGTGKVAHLTLEALEDTSLDVILKDGILVANNQLVAVTPDIAIQQTRHYVQDINRPEVMLKDNLTYGSISLSWNADNNVKEYIIQRVDGNSENQTYTEIGRTTSTHFNVYNLSPENKYQFRVIASNPLSMSQPSEIISSTTPIKDVTHKVNILSITSDKESQPGQEIGYLFDSNEDTQYHSKWQSNAIPSTLIVDLGESKKVSHLVYVPRRDAGNGTITKLTIETSNDGKNWVSTGEEINWNIDALDKIALLNTADSARYIKLNILAGRGEFVSGQELYVIEKEVLPNTDTESTFKETDTPTNSEEISNETNKPIHSEESVISSAQETSTSTVQKETVITNEQTQAESTMDKQRAVMSKTQSSVSKQQNMSKNSKTDDKQNLPKTGTQQSSLLLGAMSILVSLGVLKKRQTRKK